jgi:hypothetical protein
MAGSMKDAITQVEIKNFKSIKDLTFEARKVNLFIGEPNVGKSNIIEALSLFSVPMGGTNDKRIKEFIRFRELRNLFYENNTSNLININLSYASTPKKQAYLSYYDLYAVFELLIYFPGQSAFENRLPSIKSLRDKLNAFESVMEEGVKLATENQWYFSQIYENGIMKGERLFFPPNNDIYKCNLLRYIFDKDQQYNTRVGLFLLPPDGRNLVKILHNYPDLINEIQPFFEKYGYELLLNLGNFEFELQRRVGKAVFKYPYELTADTLQRIIFYLAAVETNQNSVILLEEPETHSFPPYIKMLADRISQHETNQFFIATHSPYLLETLIENTPAEDIAVYITYYKDYQTKLKLLAADDLRDVLDSSVDIFFNLDRYLEE